MLKVVELKEKIVIITVVGSGGVISERVGGERGRIGGGRCRGKGGRGWVRCK